MEIDCIFCKIIAKQIPTSIIEETETILVIKDISPQAPIHYLIIPKEHRKDLLALGQKDREMAADILYMTHILAKKHDVVSFKLVNNNGAASGQSVFHIHFHFLAGKAFNF